jgi:hypothetical protein
MARCTVERLMRQQGLRGIRRSKTQPDMGGRLRAWAKAFLRAGILTEEGLNRETVTGTPQGGILVPAAGQHRPVRSGRALRRRSTARSAACASAAVQRLRSRMTWVGQPSARYGPTL